MKQIIFFILCSLILSSCGLKKPLFLESKFKDIQDKKQMQ
jgi:predicted small lipoprotein YifL